MFVYVVSDVGDVPDKNWHVVFHDNPAPKITDRV